MAGSDQCGRSTRLSEIARWRFLLRRATRWPWWARTTSLIGNKRDSMLRIALIVKMNGSLKTSTQSWILYSRLEVFKKGEAKISLWNMIYIIEIILYKCVTLARIFPSRRHIFESISSKGFVRPRSLSHWMSPKRIQLENRGESNDQNKDVKIDKKTKYPTRIVEK